MQKKQVMASDSTENCILVLTQSYHVKKQNALRYGNQVESGDAKDNRQKEARFYFFFKLPFGFSPPARLD